MKGLPAVCAACLALCSCSTPNSRIKGNLGRFQSYPASAQESIRAGKVELGFTEEMARMALGAPDRIYRRTTAQGEQTVWAYTEQNIQTGSVYLDPGLAAASAVPQGTIVTSPAEERLRVTFEGGKAVSIERREK